MLDRLGVQQKLSLLLALPLAALVLTGVPFAVGRIDNVIAASTTADAARETRQVATLVEDLQQERLLALAMMASPDTDRRAYAASTAASADSARQVASCAGRSPNSGRWRTCGSRPSPVRPRRCRCSRRTTPAS
jgi:hypothetical protein